MLSKIAAFAGLAFSLACVAGSASAAPYMVQFVGGEYPIAISCPSAPATPCDLSTNANLQVAISGVEANFTVTVGGDPSATQTFTLPDYLAPTGVEPGGSPYFSGSNLTNTSWDTAADPDVVFWSAEDGGGITIADMPNDNGTTLIKLFASEQTTGSPFILTPEPMTWSLMLVGAALTGAAVRRRRARAA